MVSLEKIELGNKRNREVGGWKQRELWEEEKLKGEGQCQGCHVTVLSPALIRCPTTICEVEM